MKNPEPKILRFLEKKGPATTQEIAEYVGLSAYTAKIKLLQLQPDIRYLHSKVHGPVIWWIPSLYEYMQRVASERLKSLGLTISEKPELDFYGEGKERVGGLCTTVLDKEEIKEKLEKYDLDRFIVLTVDPPKWRIGGVEIWTLLDIPTTEGITFIPIDAKLGGRMMDMCKGEFSEFCSRIVRVGMEAKRWGF